MPKVKRNEVLRKIKGIDWLSLRQAARILGESTMNIGTINRGVSTNVVPDQCTIETDIRTVPGQKHANIKKDILRLLEKVTKENHMTYELETINNLSCVSTPLDHEFIKLANEINRFLFNRDEYPGGVNYYTDALFSVSLYLIYLY